jgi:hypothetical protein
MRNILFLLFIVCQSCLASSDEHTYVGSTPAHEVVRDFLGIPQGDSIDFIRWKLVIDKDSYQLNCRYGVGKPGTAGFIDEKRVDLSGKIARAGNYYQLSHHDKTYSVLEINPNLLYLLDKQKNLLVGNGGFSYVLNSTTAIKSTAFNFKKSETKPGLSMAYEGRTPCTELSSILTAEKRERCLKLKWYFIFHTDSVTGHPSHYLTAGTAYREETMARGNWEIIKGKDGRTIYKLTPDSKAFSLYLLKADDNILFFTDAEGNLLVGDENFSYALNRRSAPYPRR